MIEAFAQLSNTDLRELVAALKTRRIAPPYSEVQVSRVLPRELGHPVAQALCDLEKRAFTPEHVVTALEMLQKDRSASRSAEPPIDLVVSGPEAPSVTNRDTAVVVRELFAHATKSVLIVGYAVYQGARVFEALAERMEQVPELDVEMFLDIARQQGDTSRAEIVVSRFSQRFKSTQWPTGRRLPKVYYDPRSSSDENPIRSSLHAKCIVVDGQHVFVSSANFTEAGQQRNIEVGLKIDSSWLADRIARHFRLLREHGIIARAF